MREHFIDMPVKRSSSEVLQYIKDKLGCDDKRAKSVYSQITKPIRKIVFYHRLTKTWSGVDWWNARCPWDMVITAANERLGAEYGVWSSDLGELRTMTPCGERQAIKAVLYAIGCGKVSPSKASRLFAEFSRPLYQLIRYDEASGMWHGWELLPPTAATPDTATEGAKCADVTFATTGLAVGTPLEGTKRE